MLSSAESLVKTVAKKLELSDKEIKSLLSPHAILEGNIKLDDGRQFKAFRVQHNNSLGPFKGGIRFHPEVNEDEVRALALLMSLKTAAIGLPLGGGKGGVVVDPKELNDNQKEELSRKYVQLIYEKIGPHKDVPAPDVNTNGQIIDWMVDEFQKLTGDQTKASFTGKTILNGGSEGRIEATGRGGAISLREVLNHFSENSPEYSIQGFGNVGIYFAATMHELLPQAKLVAVSDSSATLVNKDGLDVEQLKKYKEAGGRFKDFELDNVLVKGSEYIISHKVDVLCFAALGDVVTTDNFGSINARYILELANGPVSDEAHDKLTDENVIIIPDIIANAGGVVVSYLEWKQNLEGEHWDLEKVRNDLEKYIVDATQKMIKNSEQTNSSLKDSATQLAIKRILKV